MYASMAIDGLKQGIIKLQQRRHHDILPFDCSFEIGLFYSLSLAQANEKKMKMVQKRGGGFQLGNFICEGGTLLGLSVRGDINLAYLGINVCPPLLI
jgi:hypothetical protein